MTHLVVSHGLILVEGFEAILVDRREMNKYIFGPIICSSHTTIETFPPSCVGETGRTGAPGRREVGHGNLAER